MSNERYRYVIHITYVEYIYYWIYIYSTVRMDLLSLWTLEWLWLRLMVFRSFFIVYNICKIVYLKFSRSSDQFQGNSQRTHDSHKSLDINVWLSHIFWIIYIEISKKISKPLLRVKKREKWVLDFQIWNRISSMFYERLIM